MFTLTAINLAFINKKHMSLDSAEMVNEVKEKVILHWNCRGLTELPEIIRKYGSHIQEIYLKWNKLTTLPPWIIELLNITNLYVYGNLIRELPTEFGKMSQLIVLDLSANKLEEIPSCIGNLLNIKSLLLNDNGIKKLPIEMSQLHNLQTLSLSGNKFVALPEWLGSLSKLKELNVDNNYLKELPNRLTLAPVISMISVCSNRLRYLPLNGFASSPCIRFDANRYLNYLSYPLLFQLACQFHSLIAHDSMRILDYKYFKLNYESNSPNTNVKLIIKTDLLSIGDMVIELPRQILKVHNASENKTVSLWELALRRVYRLWYKHTLSISTSPLNIKVFFQQNVRNDLDISMYSINYTSYNLLINGPSSICVNDRCQQPIFTEAWVITGISHRIYSITTVALCCCKRCASEFLADSSIMMNLHWHCVN